MKNVFRLLAVAAIATTFSLAALAQTATPTPAAAAGPCTEADAQAAIYKKFLDNYKGTPEQQKIANDAGNEYLTKYGNCPDDSVKQIAAFIQKWVGKYEAATVEFNCTKAVNENPAQALQACQDLMRKNPDNPKYPLMLVAAGIKNVSKGDKSLNAQTVQQARRALELIEAGKTTDSWAPFANQADAPSGLRYYIGFLTWDTAPEDAATNLLKVAQSNSSFAKEPSTYQLLGVAYYNGELKRLAAEYKDKCENKEATPECDQLLTKVNAVLDRVIDAYARAVALSNGKAQYADLNGKAKTLLTTLYKQRHDNSDAGLNELIANVLSKPVMLPGQEPALATPVNTSSATTGGTDGANGTTTTPANGTTAKPAATPTPANGVKPASTTTPPAKPVATPTKPPKKK
ncbi:MAG TPA: hypothetical protein VJ866_25160 [Pyrinomonadaceae bacterium]|nr:hypothetical protein [Pyrinomonadaceae bacterium]